MRASEFKHIVVIDFETTGIRPGALPVEVAWIQVDHRLNELDRAHSLVNPGMPIDPEASAVNKITDDMVAASPTLDEFVRSMQGDPFAAGRTLVIAHNAHFDYPHFTRFCGSSEYLCTLRLARHIFGTLENHRLQTVCDHLGLSGTQEHRAMADAEMCLALTKHFASSHADGVDDLLTLSASALAEMRMPFGKHKNTPIADLPASYVRWMRAEMTNLNGDLEACLDLHHSPG